jgi:hypothetical protein
MPKSDAAQLIFTFLVAEQRANHVVADVQAGNFHQVTADCAVVDQHLHLAVGGAKQRRHRVALAADVGIAIELTKAGLHRFEGREQLLELEVARGQFGPAFERLVWPLSLMSASSLPPATPNRSGCMLSWPSLSTTWV